MDNRHPSPVTWTIPLCCVLCYAFWPILELPLPLYAPELRQIFWSKPDDVLLMGWYGRFLMAAIAGIPAGFVLALLSRRLSATVHKAGPWLAAAATILAMTLTAVHEINKWMLR